MYSRLQQIPNQMQSDALFTKYGHLIEKYGPDLVKKVGFVYQFEVAPAKGQAPTVWTLDLKNGNGSIKKGKEGKPDVTISVLDGDIAGLFNGTLKPQTAFMQGKIKVRGNMQAALKFTPDMLPKEAKL